MEFRLLGPLELVVEGQRLELPAGKPRALLALLLLEAGQVVSVDRLVEGLWGERAPATAAKIVQAYVSRVRRLLPAGTLETRSPGYVLRVAGGELDLAAFERLRTEARAAVAVGAHAEGRERLEEALALWRGPALADVAGELERPGELARLEELRLAALEDRIEADLALGGGVDLVAELEALTAAHPFRERLRGQLMRALYRAGRQVEALATYRTARELLVGELGLEPGAELQELERRILLQDRALAPPVVRLWVPPPVHSAAAPLVGRARELAELAALLRRPELRLVTVVGPAGVGKTRLALALAELAPAALFVPLAAAREASFVHGAVAQALATREQQPGEGVRGPPPLLVLDGLGQLADTAPVVAELLAASPELRLVVTSRVPLDLDGEHRYPVAPLGQDDAEALLVARAGAAGAGLRRSRAAAELCRRLGGLPLALELVAARACELAPEELLRRLDHDLSENDTLRAALAGSYALLEPEEQRLLARLAGFTGGWTRAAAEQFGEAGPEALDRLVATKLVEREGERYSLLEPIRDYVRERRAVAGVSTVADLAVGVFVGRQRELAALQGAVESALAGHGRLVLLVGEPGIGKTRTSLELAAYARLRLARVLLGRCHENQDAPAYWPFVQPLRAYIRGRDPEQLRQEAGPVAPALAEIIPELRERLGPLSPLPSVEPREARFRLFDAVTVFLRNASAVQPLLLVLDDLHWADAGTLALLRFLAHELKGARLLLLGTYRDVEVDRRHPLAATLAELTREQLVERVPLGGLSEVDVEHFIGATLRWKPQEALVRTVYTQTDGNPLFVTEVVRLLGQEGELRARRDSGSVRIPDGLREVIERRLGRLTERCQTLLRTASLLGREFSLQQLTGLSEDSTEAQVLDLVEEALAARIVEEVAGSVGRYQFTHALVQDTLLGGISAARRARLHASIAEVLERLYTEGSDQQITDLVFHLSEAQPVLCAEGLASLVSLSLLAGERALAVAAPEHALGHFQRSLRLAPDAASEACAESLFGLGRAQLATFPPHELAAAIATLREAFDRFVERGQTTRALEVAAQLYPSFSFLGLEGATDLLDKAVRLAPAESLEGAQLRAVRGWLVGAQGDYPRARDDFARALSVAEAAGDIELEANVLANATGVSEVLLDWPEVARQGRRAIELAHRVGNHRAELLARLSVGASSWLVGDGEAMRAHVPPMLALAEKRRDPESRHIAHGWASFVALFEGELALAREQCELSLVAVPYSPRMLAVLLCIEYFAGNLARGAELIELHRSLSGSRERMATDDHALALASLLPLCDRIARNEDYLRVSEPLAVAILEEPSASVEFVRGARRGLALIAVARGDTNAAETLYSQIEPNESGTINNWPPISGDRLLGLLAATLGRSQRAVEHFEAALAFVSRAGYRVEHAWTAYDYAQFLRQDDPRRAHALEEEAFAAAHELDMPPLITRVLAHRQRLGA